MDTMFHPIIFEAFIMIRDRNVINRTFFLLINCWYCIPSIFRNYRVCMNTLLA
uniref:Uncharacterized protein n=1 Tax=Arundo donax TaxID=35708 RepID=A0A0A9B0P9_ARUDO